VKTILVSAGVSLILALFGTPLAIRVFTRRGYGQLIREEGPAAHATKRGTPTMGGTVIVVATLIGYFVGHVATSDPMSASGLLVLMLMAGLGLVGFIDDFIKIYKQTSLGLRSGAKLAGQAVVGGLFALLVVNSRLADGYDLTPADAHLSFLRDFGPSIGVAPFVLWIMFLIAGTSNAVNLTDGLDGLAIGCTIIAAGALTVLTYVSGHIIFSNYLELQRMPMVEELTVFCGAIVGASIGFLWYNAHPAEVFMGDVGSLALGGAIATVAVVIRQELLLPFIGGIFMLEAVSVLLQVGSYKLRKKRIFKMAPLHHHFELLGWKESKVIARFWIAALVFALFALTTLKLR
jgi:phospho-N-acetylmuramoyl-pentapeptide-transferase